MDPFWLGVLVTLAIEGGLVVAGAALALGAFFIIVRM